jgi:hypothetical protein
MVKDVQQGQRMLLVAAELGLPKIIDNHVPDFFAAMLVGQKVLSECCCSDFGQVFVLGDGEHLLFGQAAEPDAILKRDHVRPSPARAVSLDHLVGAGEQRRRQVEAECFRRRQIDDEIELGRLLDGDVARLCPAQNLVDKLGSASP